VDTGLVGRANAITEPDVFIAGDILIDCVLGAVTAEEVIGNHIVLIHQVDRDTEFVTIGAVLEHDIAVARPPCTGGGGGSTKSGITAYVVPFLPKSALFIIFPLEFSTHTP
jgi:hypothetical protein